jgi:hypothetical protein
MREGLLMAYLARHGETAWTESTKNLAHEPRKAKGGHLEGS